MSEIRSNNETAPSESCVSWVCGDKLVWLHYVDGETGQEIWTYHLTYDYDQEDQQTWAECLLDQQEEFSVKNYTQHKVSHVENEDDERS